MSASSIFRQLREGPVFTASDAAYLAVDDEGVIRAVSSAYLTTTGRTEDELLGVAWYDALFPDNPDDPGADGVALMSDSFDVVLREVRRDPMALQRYDIRVPGTVQHFEPRYWHVVNSPLTDERGVAVGVLNHAQDVTPALGSILAESASPARLPTATRSGRSSSRHSSRRHWPITRRRRGRSSSSTPCPHES